MSSKSYKGRSNFSPFLEKEFTQMLNAKYLKNGLQKTKKNVQKTQTLRKKN